MTVNLIQWRSAVGIFNSRRLATPKKLQSNPNKKFESLLEILFLFWHCFESGFIFLLILVYLYLFLQCHGDIETNPGPKHIKNKSISVYH